jgi:hypothetical protein
MNGAVNFQPSAKCNGVVFVPVPAFTDADAVFGANRRSFFNRHDIPYVPSKYTEMASSLFFSGGKVPAFSDDIDRAAAMRALRAWLSSFSPAHEAKIATVGYALWAWIEGVER